MGRSVAKYLNERQAILNGIAGGLGFETWRRFETFLRQKRDAGHNIEIQVKLSKDGKETERIQSKGASGVVA